MSIKHLLSYVVRGTSSEALQKLPEMAPFNLRIERRTLQDILANVFLPPSKNLIEKTTECGQMKFSKYLRNK